MSDPFRNDEKPKKALIARCYVCGSVAGCLVLAPPEYRVATFKGECDDCPEKDKPTCTLTLYRNKDDIPHLCRSCASRTGG